MNLGDGLLFELENGKPKLILLNHEEKVQKNPVKPRLPSVLSCRQPSRLDMRTPRTEEQPIRKQNALNGKSHQNKPGGRGRGGAIVRVRGQTVTTAKTQGNHAPGKEVNANAKVKVAKPQNVRPTTKPEEPKKKAGLKVAPSSRSTPLQDNEACLTHEQFQHILNVVQTNDYPPNTKENQAECVPESEASETEGPEEIREKTETGNAPNQDRHSRGLLSWVEERLSEDRAALEAKKAQWKKELDEQVALKQKSQQSAPPRLQGEDDTESLVSVQSSVSYKNLPAAIRSSLRVGEFAPMDEVELTQEQRQEQRRRWIQELDKQQEESSERKRLEKLHQRQTEDPHLWMCHFDSLLRPLLAPSPCTLAPPPCPSTDSGETSRYSSQSQLEEVSVRASVETNSSGGHTNRASHLRTMTSLLDPAEIEERERRRLKQLEQQRAIDLQVEERRRHREAEESRRKQEEQEEERRVEQERERLQRQYERDTQRERNKSPEMEPLVTNSSEPEVQSNTAANQDMSPEQEAEPVVNHHKDTAVQTEKVHISESLEPGSSGLVSGPNTVVRAQVLQVLHKDFGAEVHEPFTRTERPKKYEKRPEWNTQRPNRRFVPASQRYPEELQRQRQESRLRRQVQLLSLQRNPTSNPHNNNTTTNQTNSQNLPPSLSLTEQSGPEENRGTSLLEMVGQPADRGRSPLHSESPAPDFLPYVRTDEVFNLRPMETQPQHSLHTAPAPQLLQKTQRQEEIIRGLAQLRQGLLQKQRELESDLSRSHLDNDLGPVSMTATYQREL